jgi:predicted RNA-binding Zn ribbon-like protein
MADHCLVVDGLQLPAKLGGHPALDFCNTLAGWDGKDPWDYLLSYESLAVWAGFAELLPEDRVVALRTQSRQQDAASTRALEDARAFRAGLYEVLLNGSTAGAFGFVADHVHAAATRLQLRTHDQTIEWQIDPQSGLAAPIDAVAWSAAQLLTSTDASLVRACPGHACGWLFLDRRGRRRWCTMTTCGNREKVRRFAARQRETP